MRMWCWTGLLIVAITGCNRDEPSNAYGTPNGKHAVEAKDRPNVVPGEYKNAAEAAKRRVLEEEKWKTVDVEVLLEEEEGITFAVWRLPKTPCRFRLITVTADGTIIEYK